jgi:hypothetical protein
LHGRQADSSRGVVDQHPLVLAQADRLESVRGGDADDHQAAGLFPFDVKMYSGAFGADPANLPMRLGAEAAGVVTAVGADATGPAGPVEVADEVIVYRAPGAYAAELVVPASSVVPKPVGLSSTPTSVSRTPAAAPTGSAPTDPASSVIQNRPTTVTGRLGQPCG